jgi:hypothetical protein
LTFAAKTAAGNVYDNHMADACNFPLAMYRVSRILHPA